MILGFGSLGLLYLAFVATVKAAPSALEAGVTGAGVGMGIGIGVANERFEKTEQVVLGGLDSVPESERTAKGWIDPRINGGRMLDVRVLSVANEMKANGVMVVRCSSRPVTSASR